MKNIVLFFGDFDPISESTISIIEKITNKIKVNRFYLGLNKTNINKKLTPLYHRKNMLKEYIKMNKKCKLISFSLDYHYIDKVIKNIIDLTNKENRYYFIIEENNLLLLDMYNKYLINNFTPIIIRKKNNIKDNAGTNIVVEDIYHEINNIPSYIENYIFRYNLYLKQKIKPYLTNKKYNHTISVNKTAQIINKKAGLGLNRYDIEKAALLHDIAKNIPEETQEKLMKEHYPNVTCHKNIYHQYLGELMAKDIFKITNKNIIDSIKYHTTGRKNMSLLEKLIYISDKIEPSRNYDTSNILNKCINNFDEGFIQLLNMQKKYFLDNNINIDKKSLECFKYYFN